MPKKSGKSKGGILNITGSKAATRKLPTKWLEQDIKNWTIQQVRKEVGRVRDAVHKRVQQLKSQELPSRALHSLMKSGGELSTKGKSLNELYAEYKRGLNFLNLPDGSITGARQYKSHLEELFGRPLSNKQTKVLFKAFHEIEKASPGGLQVYGSDKLIQYLADEISSFDDTILQGNDFNFEKYVNEATDRVVAEYEWFHQQLDESMDEFFDV